VSIQELTTVAVIRDLVRGVEHLLDSRTPHDRVRGVRCLAAGVDLLERRVVLEAQAAGMTWSDIGQVYGVTRQAAHSRFANETLASPERFDSIVADLAEPPQTIAALATAASRADELVKRR
jgi:hypothetical protein